MPLKNEEFDNDVYARNTAGLMTSCPVKCSICMEKYAINQDSVSCRWLYQKGQERTYTEASMYFEKTTKVDIKINYTNGVFKV